MAKGQGSVKAAGAKMPPDNTLGPWMERFGILLRAYQDAAKRIQEARDWEKQAQRQAQDAEKGRRDILEEMVALMRNRCGEELVLALAQLASLDHPALAMGADKDEEVLDQRFTVTDLEFGIDLGEKIE